MLPLRYTAPPRDGIVQRLGPHVVAVEIPVRFRVPSTFFAPRERTRTALYSVALRPLLLPFRFLLPLLRLLLLLAFPFLEFRRGHPHSVARLLGQRPRQPQHLSRTRVSLGRRVAHLCVRQVCHKCATSVSLLESAGSRRTHHALQRRPHGQRRAAVFPRELRRRQHPLLGEAQMISTSSLRDSLRESL